MANYTYEANSTSTLLKEGEYEATIERIEKRRTTSGKEKLSVMFRINGELHPEYKNRVLFDDIWAEVNNPQVYNRKRINQLLGTQKNIKDGQVFETIENIIDFLKGASLVLHVTIEVDTYKGEDVNNIAYYKSSKIEPKKINSITPAPTPVKPDEDNTDLLPADKLPF